MTPPPPVPITADEYDEPPPSPWLPSWAKIQRGLAWFGAAVIVIGVALLWGYSLGRGKSRGELATASVRIDSLTKARAVVDTVYRVDSVRLVQWRTRWDSVRVVDTLVRDSVVYVRRDVADSTIAVCSAVLRDCQQQRAIADSLVRVLRDMPVPNERGFLSDRLVVYGGHSLISKDWQVGVGVALWRWP